MRFKSALVKILVFLCLFICFPVYAQENEYLVSDVETGLIETFEDYDEASKYYNKHIDEYNNLLLYNNDHLIKMEYGIVCFDAEADYVDYYSLSKDCEDILCPGYGIDGAYLDSDENNVYFRLAGDLGYTNIENVELIPYEDLETKISVYVTDDEYLYHNIKTQLDFEYYSTSLKLDYIPEYLNTNSTYYSYDGHYFYDSFYTMIDDYKNETFENAVNSEPYYNYYQYLSYRSLSNYSYEELEDYFYNTLGINNRLSDYTDLNNDNSNDAVNLSQLYGNIDEFFTYQNIYGANALMLISAAINESNYGKSFNSYVTNNLYNTAAFESNLERQNDRYDSVSNSIYSQAKYFVSHKYSNHLLDDYCGSFVGDRKAGVSSTYCLDTYYGEKFAATYFDIDSKLGLKDYNAYSLAIIEEPITIYNDENLNDVKFSIKNVDELSFVILKECGGAYLIQIDDCESDDYKYDFEECVGYIGLDDVAYIINNQDCEYEFVNITYDFNGGSFLDNDYLTIKTRVGDIPAYVEPSLSGYEFIGYDKQFVEASEDVMYVAQYSKIKSISISSFNDKQIAEYPNIDLSDAYINVKYEDGTRKKITITSDMLSCLEACTNNRQTISINYCGLSVDRTIRIDNTYEEIYENITNALNEGDYEYIKNNIDSVEYKFSMSDIRTIDAVLSENNKRNYVIKDNTNNYDFSISGLDLSLADQNNFVLFKDTYYVLIDDINEISKNKIEEVSKGYGFDSVEGINISFKFNFQNIYLNGPAVIQLDVADKQNDCIYTVYHLDDDGNIVKCYTSQSNNYVQFIIYEEGDYLLLSKDSINTYDIEDNIENLNYSNVGFDYHKFNLNILIIVCLALIGIIGVVFYYILHRKKVKQWKDYRKSLQKADIVQEEKPKN